MKDKILALHGPKHVKIYKLHQLGLPNKEVAEAVGTNAGHVYNVLKDYKTKPEKVEQANSINVEA